MNRRPKTPKQRSGKGPPPPVYQLRVTLLETNPPVWRRILVPGRMNLDHLHAVIQRAMGWTDSHLHEFEVRGQRYGEPDPEEPDASLRPEWMVTLLKAVPAEGLRFEYLYDFGDGWTHEILVESIAAQQKGLRHPACLAGERRCPPEDCGGPYGYGEFLEAIRDPKHPEHDQMRDWIGGAFDPDTFDLAAVNRKLRLLK
jgi:hypothetical protein